MGDADARLRALYSEEWRWRREEFPDLLALDPTSPIPDRLARVDPASQAARLGYWDDVLERLDGIDPEELSTGERVDRDVFAAVIGSLAASQRFRDQEMPVTSDAAFWTECASVGRRSFLAAGDHERFVAQMRDLPRYYAEQIDQMRRGLARGFTPPRITLEGRDGAIASIVEADAERTPFFEPFHALPDGDELRAEALAVIRDLVQPAHAVLLAFVREEYLPGARTTLAAHDLPAGDAYYRAKIRQFTTLDSDPADIHAIGVTEVARLLAEMTEVARSTGFTGDLPEFIAFLRSDERFFPRDGEEMLLRAAWIAKRFDDAAPAFFGHLPRGRCAIRPVPDDIAPFYTAGRAYPGVYLLNLHEPASRPLYNLPALTLHEGEPGHVFQNAIAMEIEDVPEFRLYARFSAYGEGWALYCEELGLEMGIYQTPYEHFGMLGYQMWRAVRLVIDTGIHALGWSRERALDYLRSHTALPEIEVVTEVDRYISWPGQALSYFLGKLTITAARHEAEAALGSRFDVRDFHDAILGLGAVPLSVLQARIASYVAQTAAPLPVDEERSGGRA